MMTDNPLRALGGRSDLVDIQSRSVGAQNHLGFANLVQFGEDLFLYLHSLEDRFDRNVHLAELVVTQGRTNQSHPLVHHRLSEASSPDRSVVVPPDVCDSAIQKLFGNLLEDHWNSSIRIDHRDAASHGSGADNRGFSNFQDRSLLGETGNLRDLTLAKEDMNHCLRLARVETFLKELCLPLATLFEGKSGGGFDRIDRL